MRKAESRKLKAESWGRGSSCAPAFRFPLSALTHRTGLTLIELLVVIVILTTLVAGVIPILSPNNDTRKIREATRMLQTYIMQAQAQAARTGRAQGIAFQESSLGSGVALDVFRLEVPRPFAGFSSDSRVVVTLQASSYTPGDFVQYTGFALYRLDFRLANGTLGDDPLPPRMFRSGDEIRINGNTFLIVDSSVNNGNIAPNPNPANFFNSIGTVECVWINNNGQIQPMGEKPYKILRQPTNAVEQPVQFPAGVGIDMQGSVAEGSTVGWPDGASLFKPGVQNTVGIMFSPTGNVSNVYLNGSPLTNISRIALLLGRVENGGLDPGATPGAWVKKASEDLETWQARINWVNLDSRWLFIAPNSGRAVVSENAFVDVTKLGDPTSANEQIEAAHQFGHQMRTAGVGR